MNNENEPTNTTGAAFPCHECRAGMVNLQFVTFFTWLGDELITVPNFPAWVCDVCGRREYDSRAVNWLSALLNPDAGKSPRAKAKKGAHTPKQHPSRPSTDQQG